MLKNVPISTSLPYNNIIGGMGRQHFYNNNYIDVLGYSLIINHIH